MTKQIFKNPTIPIGDSANTFLRSSRNNLNKQGSDRIK